MVSDLLNVIIQNDATALEVLNRLRDLFEENEHSRVVALKQEFLHTHMRDFPDISAYCTRLKLLPDQLQNIRALVSNNQVVNQVVSGLETPTNMHVNTITSQNKLVVAILPCSFHVHSRGSRSN